MHLARAALVLLLAGSACTAGPPPATGGAPGGSAAASPVRIRAGRVLDGRGAVLRDVTIVVRDGRIASVSPSAAATGDPPATYDLTSFTVLPGLIDVHDHLDRHFKPDGRSADEPGGESPDERQRAVVANARVTLAAGFTTVQSPGDPADAALRAAIARGDFPGPRLLTSLEPIGETTDTTETLRRQVRERKAAGADLVKIFASESVRDGGGPTLTQEQLDAACGEARSLGLRTLVHAHSAEAVRRAVLAGCTQIEHGFFADDDVLRLMAERGVYFDPQCGLVLRNYLDNKPRYFGIENFTDAGFSAMERALPVAVATFRRALATPNLKIVFGTDAVAGAHGRNAEELLCRVREAGEAPMDAVISATSRAAESMGMGDRLGSIKPGFAADVIAVDGDPSVDVTALQRVVFVMKEGRVLDAPRATRR